MVKNVVNSISESVKVVLANYPYMEEFLRDECVNYSALARKITPIIEKKVGKKIKQEAIVMSIIRYAQSISGNDWPKLLAKIFAKSTVTLKTDMMYITIPKTISNLKVLESFYSKIDWGAGENYFIVQGLNKISVVLDKHKYEDLTNSLNKDDIGIQYPLTSILMIHSPPEAAGPGFIYYMSRDIAKAGISIEMHTMTEDTIILVDDKDASKLFDIIRNQINFCRDLAKT